MSTPQEVEAQLTGPGGPFEIVEEDVLGERMPVFKDREPHLRAILEKSAAFGDAEYIVCDDGRRITFAQHARVVASVAQALRTEFGVGKGDRVAILAANCPEWVIGFWGAIVLGAVPVGLNGWWAGEEIRYGVADCDPRVLIGDRKRLARLSTAERKALGVPVVEIESDFEKLWNFDPSAELPDEPIHEDDPAAILYTSGTTGRPKGAVNTHRNIIALARIQIFHGVRQMLLRKSSGDAFSGRNVSLVNTPLFHVSGLYAGAVTMLVTGVKTVWTTGRFDPVKTMALIEREKITNWGPMGTMIYRVVHHPDVEKYDLSSLRNVGSGGAPISPELQERMRQVFPNIRAQMGMGYGLTESTALATLNAGEELEAHPESVGRPLPTILVEIRDAEGRSLPEGEEGEIHTRSPLVMKEYWRNPEATAETILPGRWLRTGDVGRIEDGRLYVNSRKRDLILRGAENIYPVEIEHCLEAHPDVREAAVVGVDHPELGQEVKAIVVPRDGCHPDPADLERWVRERLAYYKVPAHWELRRDPLPRNATGKVLKNVLLGEAENRFVED
jgi:acyl-CoA synthetase (AMP-forming)/AMP-acid ligase II